MDFQALSNTLRIYEYIHTEHLALDEVKQSLCCYFHRGYGITNLILKWPHNHNADILIAFVKPGINIYNEFNNIYSFNKSLTQHSNKYVSGLQILWILSLYIIDGKGWQEL